MIMRFLRFIAWFPLPVRLFFYVTCFLSCFYIFFLLASRTTTEYSNVKVSSGPWSIDGVVIGMALPECEKILGKPSDTFSQGGDVLICRWRDPVDVTVSFDAGRKAFEVLGKSLRESSGRTVLSSGTSEEEFRAAVKNPRSQKHYRPKGSGVISIGRDHYATSYIFSDDRADHVVSFDDHGMMQYVSSFRKGKGR